MLFFQASKPLADGCCVLFDIGRGVVLKKEVWERTQKTSHFQHHFKLILNQ